MEQGTFVAWFTIGEDADSVRCGYLPSSEAVRDAALAAGNMQLHADVWTTSYTYPTDNDPFTHTRHSGGNLYPNFTQADSQPVLQVIPRILNVRSSEDRRDNLKITLNRNYIQNPSFMRRAFLMQYAWEWRSRAESAMEIFGPGDERGLYRSILVSKDLIEFEAKYSWANFVFDEIKIWSAPIEGLPPELEWPPGSGNYGTQRPAEYFWQGNIKATEVL